MRSAPRLSVVVPCFNEELALPDLHRRVSQSAQECVGESYEIILVNDGSGDGSWRVMKSLSESDEHLVAVSLSRNYGHQIALSAGLKLSRGNRIFILDADLQDPPELLPEMMERMDDGCEIVFGVRVQREGETVFKKASAHIFYRVLNKLVDIRIPPDTGDFRLMSRRAVDIINNMPERHRFIRGMVSWIGLRQEALPYERASRFVGHSHYSISKMIGLAFDAITGFSVRPLRIASYIGLLFSIFALLLLVYLLVEHFTGHTVHGWTSLATIIVVIGGLQMFIMGIFGEYLGRLYIESKGRPLYIIDEVVSSNYRNDARSENEKMGGM